MQKKQVKVWVGRFPLRRGDQKFKFLPATDSKMTIEGVK